MQTKAVNTKLCNKLERRVSSVRLFDAVTFIKIACLFTVFIENIDYFGK